MRRPISCISGGAGFIGSHLARELLKRDHRVVIIDDLSGGFVENIPDRALFACGSVSDGTFVNSVFRQYNFDFVFHLAAYAAENLSHFIKRFNYENNVIGSVNLINASVNYGVKRFIFTSSIAVYGDRNGCVTEDDTPMPEDSYGIAKLAIERELAISHKMFGLDYTIFRPHNVYGEFQNLGDPYRNVVGIFMNQLMQNKPMTIYGDGFQQRAFSYIGDVAPVLADCLVVPESKGETYNIGADTPYTVNELAEEVAHAMGRFPVVEHLPPRVEAKIAIATHTRVRRAFGERQQTSLQDGLAKMAAWAKQAGVRQSKEFTNIEVRKNLPAHWEKKAECLTK